MSKDKITITVQDLEGKQTKVSLTKEEFSEMMTPMDGEETPNEDSFSFKKLSQRVGQDEQS